MNSTNELADFGNRQTVPQETEFRGQTRRWPCERGQEQQRTELQTASHTQHNINNRQLDSVCVSNDHQHYTATILLSVNHNTFRCST